MVVEPIRPTRTLLIDNYDSYTYNLFHYLAEANGALPTVVRNDEFNLDQLRQRIDSGEFDNVVISPGPGTPIHPQDVGVSNLLLEHLGKVPMLGVCLGHQALGVVHGAQIRPAPYPAHGHISNIVHNQHPLFDGILNEMDFNVVRYHSLIVDEKTLPPCLIPIAWTKREGILMALAHSNRPHYGVQFHPESICTQHGKKLISNFRSLSLQHQATIPVKQEPSTSMLERTTTVPRSLPPNLIAESSCNVPLFEKCVTLEWEKLSGFLPSIPGNTENIFMTLFSKKRDTVWLDSSTVEGGKARFSFMAGKGGKLWKKIHFFLPDCAAAGSGTTEILYNNGYTETKEKSIWDYLEEELQQVTVKENHLAAALPFDFWGGFVGYFGYELKCSTCGSAVHKSRYPDASFFFVDRFIAVDHLLGDVYALHLSNDLGKDENRQWMKGVMFAVRSLTMCTDARAGLCLNAPLSTSHSLENEMVKSFDSMDQYIEKVKECMQYMAVGDSYEICLTTELETQFDGDPFNLYRILRSINPAPYSAWLSFGATGPVLCCCSPERFLKLDQQGMVEAKPIKGTIGRCKDNQMKDFKLAEELRNSPKDRAENLMIVDLLRNDLSQFCEVGSVQVPSLMQIESYATVHQLVSTVVGCKCRDKSLIQCIRAAFPGGSMTGAPKKRTMEIIDGLEGRARGPYSGSLGFLSVNGTFDLNIIIRSSVIMNQRLSIGSGGAVTVLSDPGSEYAEMQLKAHALCRGIKICNEFESKHSTT